MDLSLHTFIGIDGGGSKTRALAVDAQARPIKSYTVSGCNPHNIGFLAAGDRINEAVSHLLDSNDSKNRNVQSVFCGIAGIRNREEQSELEKSLSRFQWARNGILQIDHDLSIAYEAALGNQPGICLIAGTGAACIARSQQGEFYRASNRLPNENEPGSGYGIGKDAINAGILQSPSESRDAIANLAKSVIQIAHAGNILAREIVDAHTSSLAQLAIRVHSLAKLGEKFPIVLTGGLGTAETLFRMLTLEKIYSHFLNVEICYTNMTPVEAAAHLALRNSK